MNLEKVSRYGLIAAVSALVIGVGVAYLRASSQPVGDECPRLEAAPEGVIFEDRVRTEQRLNLDYDLRRATDGPELSCLNVLGQARCSTDGPAIIAAQLGYRGPVEIYNIPQRRTAVVRLSATRMLCVMPDP